MTKTYFTNNCIVYEEFPAFVGNLLVAKAILSFYQF